MKIPEIELVINTDFGGFRFNTEMALWLIENRQWKVLKDKEYDYSQKDKYSINTLVEGIGSDYYYHPGDDKLELRSNKDLIDCVRELKKKHENDEYPEKYYGHIHSLSIVKVAVELSIENYYDGKERVNCYSRTKEE